MTTNPHQPDIDFLSRGGLKCTAPDCNFYLAVPREDWLESWKPHFRDVHTQQYDEGRARDIEIEWVISACCSVCEDGVGDVQVNDTDTVRCNDCGTTWYMSGTGGELDESRTAEHPEASA